MTDVIRRGIGIRFDEGSEAHVTVWAPNARKVALVLKNDGSIDLTADDLGYFRSSTTALKPGDLYKIKLDDNQALPDPVSIYQPEGVHGHSQAMDLTAFSWTDGQWQNQPLKDYILYELNT